MANSAPATAPAAKPMRRRGNRMYTAIWIVLGLCAAGYLTLLATGENLNNGSVPFLWDANGTEPSATLALRKSGNSTSSKSNGNRWTQITREIDDLKDRMSSIGSDVAQIRVVQNETDQRVSTLEQWKTSAQAAAPSQKPATVSQKQPDAPDASTIEGTTLDGVTRTAEATAQPIQKPLQDNDDVILAALLGNQTTGDDLPKAAPSAPAATPPSAQTASLTPPKAAEPASNPTPAVVPIPGRRTFGVELATGDSVDSLRLSWALLNERHRDLIGRLAPRYIHTGAASQNPFRLIAGPFKSSNSAKEMCLRLQAYYVSCSASAFTGNVL